MYNAFFELDKAPFSMTPDPAFLFLTAKHREALAGLLLAVAGRKGFLVLTGEAGTGKTTLLSRTLRFISRDRVQFSFIINPTLSPSEFLEMAMIDFGIEDIPASKAQRLVHLQRFLLEGHRAGKTSVLVIDEAHKLTPEVLEEVRLLTNFETSEQKLLQILLAGQPELTVLLNREDMRQLKQRIAIRLRIDPLQSSEVKQYMNARWIRAGGRTLLPFTADAISLIARASKGIPRVINSICDNALTNAFGANMKTVDAPQILDVVNDLQIAVQAEVVKAALANGTGAKTNGTRRVPVVPVAGTVTAGIAPVMTEEPVPTTFRSLERYMPKQPRTPRRWLRWGTS
jgi:type II secretory pathway predicted ATPase ExeA